MGAAALPNRRGDWSEKAWTQRFENRLTRLERKSLKTKCGRQKASSKKRSESWHGRRPNLIRINQTSQKISSITSRRSRKNLLVSVVLFSNARMKSTKTLIHCCQIWMHSRTRSKRKKMKRKTNKGSCSMPLKRRSSTGVSSRFWILQDQWNLAEINNHLRTVVKVKIQALQMLALHAPTSMQRAQTYAIFVWVLWFISIEVGMAGKLAARTHAYDKFRNQQSKKVKWRESLIYIKSRNNLKGMHRTYRWQRFDL